MITIWWPIVMNFPTLPLSSSLLPLGGHPGRDPGLVPRVVTSSVYKERAIGTMNQYAPMIILVWSETFHTHLAIIGSVRYELSLVNWLNLFLKLYLRQRYKYYQGDNRSGKILFSLSIDLLWSAGCLVCTVRNAFSYSTSHKINNLNFAKLSRPPKQS